MTTRATIEVDMLEALEVFAAWEDIEAALLRQVEEKIGVKCEGIDELDAVFIEVRCEPTGGLPRFSMRFSRAAIADRIAAAVMELPGMSGRRLISGSIICDEKGVSVFPSRMA